MATATRNSTKKVTWWLMGIAGGLLMLGASTWAADVAGALTALRHTTAEQGERLAAEEVRSQELRDRLVRIENKIDRLIEAGK